MLFAKAGEYQSCGMFTTGHFELIIITIFGIVIALKNTINKTKEEVKQIIKRCIIAMWVLEVIKIAFKLCTEDISNLNNYVPLYYCSILLYAGLLSSFAKNRLKRVGDVFLATGGIIGEIVFMILPTTSLPAYPMLHIVSLHSFLYHGTMVYLGLLINAIHYIELEVSDIKYYATLVGTVCILAYIINKIFDCNLMFISKNFPGTPIEILYNITGQFFTPIIYVAQMTLPFYIVYGIKNVNWAKKEPSPNCPSLLLGQKKNRPPIAQLTKRGCRNEKSN